MGGAWFDDASDPSEALAISERFQGEWYNGGLSQFFANWDPQDAALVPTALRAIGFQRGAEIVAEAIAAMGPQDAWQSTGLQAMTDRALPISDALGLFDDDLVEHGKEFDKAVVNFEYRLAKQSGEEMFE